MIYVVTRQALFVCVIYNGGGDGEGRNVNKGGGRKVKVIFECAIM